MYLARIKSEWLDNWRGDILPGAVVALALIPESIAFSMIVGVDPTVGLYGAFIIALTMALIGSRVGMISSSTGSMTIPVVALMSMHGAAYLFAAGILAGALQMVFGLLRLGGLVEKLPRPVLSGFLCALGYLIFMAQLKHFVGVGWQFYVMVVIGFLIAVVLPHFTTKVPSEMFAIAVLVFINAGVHTKTLGAIPIGLPSFGLPAIPLTYDAFMIVLPFALSLAITGTIESLLTAKVLDEASGTSSNKNRETFSLGIANVLSGCFGGLAGCALIGQSKLNWKGGGRGRLSSLCSALFLLAFVSIFAPFVAIVPVAAIVAVMVMVSILTFDKSALSFKGDDMVACLVTYLVTVWTSDLALGVALGTVAYFARRRAKASA